MSSNSLLMLKLSLLVSNTVNMVPSLWILVDKHCVDVSIVRVDDQQITMRYLEQGDNQ